MLVTLFCPVYNRVYCIERTLRAMLALEIPEGWDVEFVWSDDNSTDESYQIMEAVASSYTGPWKIILNRNPENLRQGAHVERIMQLGHGDWFVEFDSDDLPMPTRLLEIAKGLREHPAMKGFSSGVEIVEGGIHHPPVSILGGQLFACGATCAWHKDVFQKFPKIVEYTGSQDIFIPFRVLLLGAQWVFDDTPTVFYTVDGTNDSTPTGLGRVDSLRHLARLKQNWIMAIRQRLADLAVFPPEEKEFFDTLKARHENFIASQEKNIRLLRYKTDYLEVGFWRKVKMLLSVPKEFSSFKFRLQLLVDLIPFFGERIHSYRTKSLQRRQKQEEAAPTGKMVAVDLSYLRGAPKELLMMY